MCAPGIGRSGSAFNSFVVYMLTTVSRPSRLLCSVDKAQPSTDTVPLCTKPLPTIRQLGIRKHGVFCAYLLSFVSFVVVWVCEWTLPETKAVLTSRNLITNEAYS